MEVEYKREMNRNYMVIRPQITGNETYAIRMLSGNKIQGLLPFQDKNLNGEVSYYYDITSKQPLSRILEYRNLSGEELKELLSELLYMLKQLERYFLDEGQLCFQPEYIYVEPATFQAGFCLIPGRKTEFPLELCELSQYLLDHVNQSDGDAVILAFSIFKECRKLNFGIEDLERCLRKRDTPEREANIQREIGEKIEKTAEEEPKEEKEEAKVPKTKDQPLSLAIWICAGIYGFIMLLIPGILIFLVGFDRIRSIVWRILLGELAASLLLILLLYLFHIRKDQDMDSEDSDQEPWEVYFQEMDEAEERMPKEADVEEPRDEEFQTVLLSARPIKIESRKLIPVNGGNEISIGYYPFLIGKNRDLTDYCLNKSGVSRLHVKIEETGTGYSVTDLNSTNGTSVNGILIEANGTASLIPGDELTIGSERYYFR